MDESMDEEFELAIELSKRTFEDEEKRRAGDTNLIQLDAEPLQDQQRRQLNNQIKRLYSHPTSLSALDQNVPRQVEPPSSHNIAQQQRPVGWNATASSSRSMHSTPTHTPSIYIPTPHFAFPISMVPSSSRPQVPFTPAPPQHAPPPPLHQRVRTTSESIGQHNPSTSNWRATNFSSSYNDPSRPPLPVRTRPPTSSSEESRSSTPTERNRSEEPPYMNSLFVPFSNGAVQSMGEYGDENLIDLDESSHEAIWREFDPLYSEMRRQRTVVVPARTHSSQTPPPIPERSSSHRASLPPEVELHENLDVAVLYNFYERTIPECNELSELRASLPMDYLPPNRFYSSVAEYLATDVESVQIFIHTDATWPFSPSSLTLTCATSVGTEAILLQVLLQLHPAIDEQTELNQLVKDFALKIFGLDEILKNEAVFGKHQYVGKCLMQGQDIKLHLGKRSVSVAPATHSQSSVTQDQVTFTAVIDPEDLMNLLSKLNAEMSAYESALNNTLKVSHHAQTIHQLVKLLCMTFCARIEPVPLHTRLQKYITATSERMQDARNDFLQSLHGLIYVFCKSTMTKYQLRPIRPEPKQKKSLEHVDEDVTVIANSLHNLPTEWTHGYCNFNVSVHMYHGTKELFRSAEGQSKNVHHDAFFPYIPLQFYAHFDQKLSLLPLEAKFVFILSAALVNKTNDPNALEERKFIATANLPLFDHERKIRQGQFFIPLRQTDPNCEGNILEPWGGLPLISNAQEPIIIVSLKYFEDFVPIYPDLTDIVNRKGKTKHRTHDETRYNIARLAEEQRVSIFELMESSSVSRLDSDEKEMFWQNRHHLAEFPEALAYVLGAFPVTSNFMTLPLIDDVLSIWTPLSPIRALQLLLPMYPDAIVRGKAVEWLREGTKSNTEFIFTFLTQLVEALRFEDNTNCALAKFIMELSLRDKKLASEIYWQLQQRIDHFAVSCRHYAQRCEGLQKQLMLELHKDGPLPTEIERQRELIVMLDRIPAYLENYDKHPDRVISLRQQLREVDEHLKERPTPLPLLPSFTCCGIRINECNIFTSNAKPLKIVFSGNDSSLGIIQKTGDDLRQDELVLQLVSVMNDIWKENNLDLKMLVFRVMPTGFCKGMVELVPECSTLREIQGTWAGVLDDDVVNRYITTHNNSAFLFEQALDNFQRSCAGWCVATYLLGIGDRHNDNILVTTKGHVFHIDFGKYFGDWQMAGGFRRDRVPFVFTPEMYYVVNQGRKDTVNYQKFIDYCTKALNLLRKNNSTLLNLLEMMVCSNIPGMSEKSRQFVEDNLMLTLSENEATSQFTQKIAKSLGSLLVRFNFIAHSVAQKRLGGISSSMKDTLSFVDRTYTEAEEGRIEKLIITGIEQERGNSRNCFYKIRVERVDEIVHTVIKRSLTDVYELFTKLNKKSQERLTFSVKVKKNSFGALSRAETEVDFFLRSLINLQMPFAHCDLVYTFCHTILRDNGAEQPDEVVDARICLLFVKLGFSARGTLSIFIGHAKNLSMTTTGAAPDSYVKTYLKPDMAKATKQKTAILKGSCHPTYNTELKYEIGEKSELEKRVVFFSVWYSMSLENKAQYENYFPLLKLAEQTPDRKGNRSMESWIECRRPANLK